MLDLLIAQVPFINVPLNLMGMACLMYWFFALVLFIDFVRGYIFIRDILMTVISLGLPVAIFMMY